MKDISRETGISVTQVSRALSGHGDVNAKTRKAVEDAAKLLGYRPNTIARGLKTGRSGLIAMILPADVDRSAQELIFELLVGLSSAVAQKGFRFLLHAAEPDSDPVIAYRDLYSGAGVDGFIVIEPQSGDPRIKFLLEENIPHVVHGKDPEQTHPFVDVDNYGLAYHLTQALTELGHRDIAFLNGPKGRVFSEARASGYLDAMSQAGITSAEKYHSYDVMTPRRGREALLRLMATPAPPTAIIAGNAMIARGLYDAAAELGLNIPNDISILAHDDSLLHYSTDSFSPVLGGSRSSLLDAWKGLAEVLTNQIVDGQDVRSSLILEVAFDLESGSIAHFQGAAAKGSSKRG